jgi:hypothetical protein
MGLCVANSFISDEVKIACLPSQIQTSFEWTGEPEFVVDMRP